MKYQLPQFIETEIKLIGPFTLKQFLWIAAGASLLFVLFITLKPGIAFFVLAIPIIAGSLALAFLKIQGMPLISYIAYMLSFYVNPKKYLYQNEAQQNLPINTPPHA